MPTQQANETTQQRAVAMRAPLQKPHLVSRSDVHLQPEGLADVGLEGEASAEAPRVSTRPADVGHTRTSAAAGTEAITKRALDVVGAIVLGLVFAPLIVAIVGFMLLSGSPVIYRHQRVGRGGRMFSCVKFRTMIPNADQVLRELLEKDPELRAEWISDRKLRRDPRVTRLGHFLRRTSLDELPQLLNVLRGEMSLVGPRPVVREELLRYGRSVGIYLSVKPGITGLWQVTGRNNTSYRRRVALDTYYVRNQNVLLDLYILAKTTGVVLRGNGAY